MDQKDEISYVNGRVLALERICAALARRMPSTATDGLPPRDLIFKELRSLKTEFGNPAICRVTDTRVVAGFSPAVQDVEQKASRRSGI